MINRVILVGNLTREPEMRALPGGTGITTFSLATNRKVKGEKQSEFHNVVTFGKTAEIAAQYLTKGKLVYVEGRIQTRSWEDKASGEKKYRTEIVAENFTMLGGGKSDAKPADADEFADLDIPL